MATKADAFPDPNGDQKAEPGDTITYTVTITNAGDMDATGVTFADNVDTNTTLVAGSVQTQPVARADTYNVIGNVRIQPGAAAGLLANDCDPDDTTAPCNDDLSISGPTTSTQNGNVNVNADGSFTYNPAPGFAGTDTFTYTVRDKGPDGTANNADDKTDTATVTLNVGNGTATPGAAVIWFIDDSAPTGGDGRLTSPFNCYTGANGPAQTCFSATAADSIGDIVFLYAGNYAGGNALLNNQRLVGQGATDTLANVAGVTVPAHSDALPANNSMPSSVVLTTTAAATNAVNLGSDNLLRGFTVGNTTGAKIAGNGFGTLTVGHNVSADLALGGTGQALALSTGTFASTSAVASVASTSSTAQGIFLNQVAGTVAFGSTQISGSTSEGIRVQQSTANVNFGDTTVGTGTAGSGGTNGVSLSNNTGGTRTFGTLNIQSNNGPSNSAFLSSGGGNTVAGATTISNIAGTGHGIDIRSLTGGTSVSFGATSVNKTAPGALVNLGGAGTANAGAVTFSSLGGTNSNGDGLSSVNNTGTITVTNNAGGLAATNGIALDISCASCTTPVDIDFAAVSASGDTNGVNLSNVSGPITTTGGAISGATGTAFNVVGGSPSMTYAGTLTHNTAGQRAVNVDGTTGGTVSFTGAVTAGSVAGGAGNTGVNINNAGGGVSFTNLSLGTSGSRMTAQAVTIAGGSGSKNLGTVSIFTTGSAEGIHATNSTGAITTASGTVNSAGAAAVSVVGTASNNRTPLNMQLTSVAANGGTKGIILNNTSATGSPGGFKVTGADGGDADALPDAGTGGTIQNASVRGAEFVNAATVNLGGMNFSTVAGGGGAPDATNATGTCGSAASGGSNTGCYAGVHLDTVTDATLQTITVSNSGQMGINGNAVTNLTMNTVSVNNAGTSAQEDGIRIYNLGGTGGMTNVTVATPFAMGINLENTTATLASEASPFLITNAVITNSTAAQGAVLHTVGSGTVYVKFVNGTISGHFSVGIQTASDVGATGTLGLYIDGTSFSNNAGAAHLQAGGGTHKFDIRNVTQVARSTGASHSFMLKADSAGTLSGSVIGNTIGNNTAFSGAPSGSAGISMDARNSSHISAIIRGNTIRHAEIGVDVGGGQGTATVDTIITGNYILDPEPGSVAGIYASSGVLSADTNCVTAQIGGLTAYPGSPTSTAAEIQNRIEGAWGSSGIRVIKFFGGGAPPEPVFNLPGYNGSGVVSWIQARNSFSGVATPVTQNAGGGGAFTGGTSCPGGAASPVSFDDETVASPTRVLTASPDETAQTRQAPQIERAPVNRRPRVVKPTSAAVKQLEAQTPKRAGGTTFRFAAADTSAPLNPAPEAGPAPAPAPEPLAQKRRKVLAPVLTDGSGGPNPPGTGGTVNVNVGTLALGDSVTITFQVTVEDPYDGGPNVSNQGTVSGSNFSSVLTDDPDVAGTNNLTLTPINSIDIVINDGKVAEPASPNMIDMVFTVALSQPAAGAVTINFATADGTATAGTCGSPGADYVTTNGQVIFAAGQQVRTINVPVCSDAAAEGDETLTVTLSAPSAGTLVDGMATGTITTNTAGTFLISELRTSGPGGLGDDFIELYNNSGSPLTIAASDISAGYGIYKMGATCNDTPVLIGTIPNGTVIPARGHYLLVGSQYSLANYGGTGAASGNLTMSADVESDGNVAVFSTSNVQLISSANRLDAVGFGTNTGAVCDLLREPSNLVAVSGSTTEHSFFRFMGQAVGGNPKDTNDNAADFTFVDTQGTFISGIPQKLGAPGPENIASPIRRDTSGVGATLLDGSVSTSSHPNRTRSFTADAPNNSTFGTLTVRRRVFNNTGGPVTRLRFRIVEMTTFPSTGQADLRARTGVNEVSVGPVSDQTTCTASGAGAAPCNVAVLATTLETPPNQPNGGGVNSTLSAGTVTLGTPLANGASMNVNFLLGIQQTGSFRFLIIIEALP